MTSIVQLRFPLFQVGRYRHVICFATIRWLIFTTFAATVIYHYITTFTTEVDLFWRRKFNGATFLFLGNRYLLPSLSFMQITAAFEISDEVR